MMLIGKVRVTHGKGGMVIVEVECQYGCWYKVFEGKFSEMKLDAAAIKTLPAELIR